MPLPATGTFNYWLAPWVLDTSGSVLPGRLWTMPVGTKAGFDLRAAGAILAAVPEGFGFFAVDPAAPDPDGGYLLGNDLAATLPNRVNNALQSRLNLSAGDLAEPTIIDTLWRILTDLADATASNYVKGLIPNSERMMTLYLHGHGLLKSQPFQKADHPRVMTIARAGVAEVAVTNPERFAKYLANEMRRLSCTSLELGVAPSGGASYSDTFTTADVTAVPGWTDVDGDWQISTNRIVMGLGANATTQASTRYDTALDSIDQEVICDFVAQESTSSWCGPAARFAAAAESYYAAISRGTNLRAVYRVNTGTSNSLTGSDAGGVSAPITDMSIKIDGNDYTMKIGVTTIYGPTTDASPLTAGLYAGMWAHPTLDSYGDEWSAADLAAAAAVAVRRNLMMTGMGR